MPALRPVAVLVVGLLLGSNAQAGDPSRSLDAVDTGRSTSLDAADTGKSGEADAADTEESASLDAVDDGESRSLDAADTGKAGAPDAADTEGSVSLDTAEAQPLTPPSPPAALPEISDASARAEAQAAHDAAVAAEQRLVRANGAYSDMMTHGYPSGDARLAIVQERDAARRVFAEASARYAAILQQLQ